MFFFCKFEITAQSGFSHQNICYPFRRNEKKLGIVDWQLRRSVLLFRWLRVGRTKLIDGCLCGFHRRTRRIGGCYTDSVQTSSCRITDMDNDMFRL